VQTNESDSEKKDKDEILKDGFSKPINNYISVEKDINLNKLEVVIEKDEDEIITYNLKQNNFK